jgi:RHS repeat-associated protein
VVSGAVARSYTYGLDLISQRQAGGISFYGYDGHGSVRFLTDATGNVTDRYDYDAFGVLIGSTGVTANVYLYSGEQFDGSLGRYYLRARYYTQNRGVFMTADKAIVIAYNPLVMHLYNYALNNPSNRKDPSGNFSLAELTSTVTIEEILSKISFHYLFFTASSLRVVYKIYKPAFVARNGAIRLISETENPDIINSAIDTYNAANRLIAYGSDVMKVAQALSELGQTMVDLSGSLKNAFLLPIKTKGFSSINQHITILGTAYNLSDALYNLGKQVSDVRSITQDLADNARRQGASALGSDDDVSKLTNIINVFLSFAAGIAETVPE